MAGIDEFLNDVAVYSNYYAHVPGEASAVARGFLASERFFAIVIREQATAGGASSTLDNARVNYHTNLANVVEPNGSTEAEWSRQVRELVNTFEGNVTALVKDTSPEAAITPTNLLGLPDVAPVQAIGQSTLNG